MSSCGSVTIRSMTDFDDPRVRLCAKLFCLIGMLLLIGAVIVYASASAWQKRGIETTAEITDFSRDGFPYVRYQAGGQVYESRLNYSTGSMRAGDTIRIRYDPEDPRDAKSVNGSLMALWIVGGLGVFFTGLGITFLCLARKARNMKAADGDASPYKDSPYHSKGA